MIEIATNFFQNLINLVPTEYRPIISLFLYTFFIAIYAIFIWRFYKFLASREIIALNLKQYNYSQHPGLEKILAVLLYTVEYMVILPFLVLFWFAVLSLFLLFLSESQSAHQILLISAAVIASTRITAYVNEELSRDLAKILPFTMLGIFILNPNFFEMDKLITRFSEIPSLFNNILMFIIFIFLVEFILRGLYSLAEFFYSGEEGELDENRVETRKRS